MDFVRLVPTASALFGTGEILNGIESSVWIERYRDAGECQITADISSGLAAKLPLGSYLTHLSTLDVMEIDVHTINGTKITASGRSLTAILDQRAVAAGVAYNNPNAVPADYVLSAAAIPTQCSTLIRNHIEYLNGAPLDDSFGWVDVFVGSGAISGESVERIVERGSLYNAVIELLALYDHGIRATRGVTTGRLGLSIHSGTDKTSTVTFSEESGELLNAEYVSSTRPNKNVAFVQGKYVHTFYYAPDSSAWKRRVLFVDASDIDEKLTEAPVGAALTAVQVKMQTRGKQALLQNNSMNLVRADISSNTRYRYRTDYNVGDFVSVEGMLGASSIRRVTEYTEIEDSNGTSGHPTLSTLEV